MVFWGLGVRMVYVLHVTWMINSVTHMWGTRRYETTDDSRNLWWVGLLAFGEGWHNNHHAYQRVASQGHRWWEIDVDLLHDLDDGEGRAGLGRRAAARYSEGHEAGLVLFTHFQRSSNSPTNGVPVILRTTFSRDLRRNFSCAFDLHFGVAAMGSQ